MVKSMGGKVNVYRGQHLESTHDFHAAVVNSEGTLLYYSGNPDRYVFPRSSMKPFQIIPVLESGVIEAFSLKGKEISVMCSSHSGEAGHIDCVRTILQKGNLPENALQCGTHIPRDIDNYNDLIRNGGQLTPIFSNCSGKHSGMLLAISHMGEDIDTYRDAGHPHQLRIIEAICDVCDYPADRLQISIDGCGVPVHGLPLNRVALGFSRLAAPEKWDKDDHRKRYIAMIRDAMTGNPCMVAGTDRFDTDLMDTFNGRLVAKGGAEGFQCIGDRESGTGIAVKVEDGNNRAATVIALEILRQLGICSEEEYKSLEKHAKPAIMNARNERVGSIIPDFVLKKHSQVTL